EAVHQGCGDVGRQHPDGGPEQRDVDLDPRAGALALEERRGDASGDCHATDEVAEGGSLLERGLSGGGEAVRDAATGPERYAVVAATPGVGPAPPLPGAASVDEPRIHRAQVVPGDPEALACVVEEARQEDVGAGHELQEESAPVGMREVDPDAPLVAPQVLDEEIPARGSRNEPRGDEPADRVAEARGLDLADLAAPVARPRPPRRPKAPSAAPNN